MTARHGRCGGGAFWFLPFARRHGTTYASHVSSFFSRSLHEVDPTHPGRFDRRLAGRAGRQRQRADQVGPAQRLPGQQLSHREPGAVRQGCASRHGWQAHHPGARQRLAVQGARDQARRAGRASAGGRVFDGELPERMAAVGPGRPALPGHQLRRVVQALPGQQGRRAEEAGRAGHDAAVRGGVAAAGHLQQEASERRRRHEGHQMARLQPGHRAHRRVGRRAARHGAAGRTVASHGHGRG